MAHPSLPSFDQQEEKHLPSLHPALELMGRLSSHFDQGIGCDRAAPQQVGQEGNHPILHQGSAGREGVGQQLRAELAPPNCW
ncbi:hypothetical protein PMIN06_013107 [Paraphaeosphaeria minitans]